jgi:hypothetical protein
MKKEVPNLQVEMFTNLKVLLKDLGNLPELKEKDNLEQIEKDRQKEQNISKINKEMNVNL